MVRVRRLALFLCGALLGAALLLLLQSCSAARAPSTPELPRAATAPLEVWVDAQAAEGGDGSAARPLRQLGPAFSLPGAHRLVHLASGLYPGPFLAPDGTALVGGKAAVLTGPAGVTVLETRGAVRLERLFVQGGQVGLVATGALVLSDVHFSGQRQGAVSLGEGTTLEAEGAVFEASVSGGVGLLVEAHAQVRLLGCTFEGPWQRAIEAHAPENLQLVKSNVRGAVTALHQRDGRADVSDVTISEGRGPALYVAGGALGLQRVQVQGHEYALLTGSGAVVEAETLSATGAERAGVAVVKAKAHFRELTITRAGTYGGLQCVSSDVTVEGLHVKDVAGAGVSTRDGSLRLEGAEVTLTRDRDGAGGDGLQLRGGRATLLHLTVRKASGACLLAAEGTDVILSHASLEGCHTAGLAVETAAHLAASDVTVDSSDGPGAVATSEGELLLLGFRAVATDGVLWAECANGARVRTWDVKGALPELPCVERLSTSPAPGVP